MNSCRACFCCLSCVVLRIGGLAGDTLDEFSFLYLSSCMLPSQYLSFLSPLWHTLPIYVQYSEKGSHDYRQQDLCYALYLFCIVQLSSFFSYPERLICRSTYASVIDSRYIYTVKPLLTHILLSYLYGIFVSSTTRQLGVYITVPTSNRNDPRLLIPQTFAPTTHSIYPFSNLTTYLGHILNITERLNQSKMREIEPAEASRPNPSGFLACWKITSGFREQENRGDQKERVVTLMVRRWSFASVLCDSRNPKTGPQMPRTLCR